MPGAERGVIEDAKLRGYLLSSEHPIGRFKARFFAALGFVARDSDLLERALMRSPARSMLRVNDLSFGLSYEGRPGKPSSSVSGSSGQARHSRGL